MNCLWGLFGKRLRTSLIYCIPVIVGNHWRQYNRKPSLNEWTQLTTRSAHLVDKKKSLQELHDNAINTLVRIRYFALDFGGKKKFAGHGTGWVADKSGLVVTNCHVTEEAPYLEVDMYHKDSADNSIVLIETRPGNVVYVEPEHDLSVVQMYSSKWQPLNLPTATISEAIPAVGTEVTPIGFAAHLNAPSITTGIVVCNDCVFSDLEMGNTECYFTPGHKCMILSAVTFGGASGGPTLDPSGAVCGINFGGGIEKTLALHMNCFKGVIDRSNTFPEQYCENKYFNHNQNSLGITVHEFDEKAREIADEEYWREAYGQYGNRNSIIIWNLLEITSSNSESFNIGDLIVKVDGKDVTNIRQLKREIRGKQQMIVSVVRDGDLKDLPITRQPIDYYFM